MIIEKNLTPQEKKLFTEILYNKKTAFTWNFFEIKKIRPEIAPPQKIKTIPHTT